MNIEAKGMEDDVLPARHAREHEQGEDIPRSAISNPTFYNRCTTTQRWRPRPILNESHPAAPTRYVAPTERVRSGIQCFQSPWNTGFALATKAS
jgi:hypothetical protein